MRGKDKRHYAKFSKWYEHSVRNVQNVLNRTYPVVKLKGYRGVEKDGPVIAGGDSVGSSPKEGKERGPAVPASTCQPRKKSRLSVPSYPVRKR